MTTSISNLIPLRIAGLVAAAVSLSCGSPRERRADSAAAPLVDSLRSATAGDKTAPALCPTPAGGIRIAIDSVAGMPADLTVSALRRLCTAARADPVPYAGFTSPAIRFDYAGATVWAVQNIANTDTLVADQRAAYWAAVGDSLRFPDGRLIPRRLGQLRMLESDGVMFINSGDDTEGADVSLCRFPGLSFFFDTLPAPADTSVRPFAGIPTTDTMPFRRAEQYRDSVALRVTRQLCHRAGTIPSAER